MEYNFQWDPKKARSNVSKHGISFRLATQVFKDPRALTLFDEEHSLDEERWMTLGLVPSGQCLVIIHTFEEQGNEVDVRLISARKATRQEVQDYQGAG
ncbi:MAG: BrnT family toxin [Thermosynechococcaceae cyanobacterium]